MSSQALRANTTIGSPYVETSVGTQPNGERCVLFRFAPDIQQRLIASHDHLEERLRDIEKVVGLRNSGGPHVLPPPFPFPAWERRFNAWRRHFARRLKAIETLLSRPDRIELDGDALAERMKRPDVARSFIRLLFGTTDAP